MNNALRAGQRALGALTFALGWTLAGAALAAPTPTPTQEARSNSKTPAMPDYAIGAGDLVRINVFQNPDLTLETRVSEGGVVSYPLLGNVKLGGLSAAEAERSIANGLREGRYLKDPQVTVLVMQVRSNQVSVLGTVTRPGRYPIDVVGMRLTEALSLAGGVAPGGSDVAVLSGVRDGKPYHLSVDVSAIATGDRSRDPIVEGGDVVYVDRMPLVYIYGQVQRPGPMRLERDMTLLQALAGGGGPNDRGTESHMKVHRRSDDGHVEVLELQPQDKLREGDVIYVRESIF